MKDDILGLQTAADGKYHWYYEMSMFKNPTLLITLYKVFGGIVIGCGLGLGLILWASTGEISEAWGVIKGFALAGVILLVLVAIGYVIYAAIQGGKYCVVFEMDDESVTHTQLDKQFQKAQVIAGLAAIIGAKKGSLTMMGTGLLAGSRGSMSTLFEKVTEIKVKRRRDVIYLRGFPKMNQIYVQKNDFDAVLAHILSRIPQTAKRRGCD